MFSYITRIALTISEEIPYATRILSILDQSIESNAFLKSMKVITASFLCFHSSSMILLSVNRRDEVDLLGRKPFWLGRSSLSMTAYSV